jgi:hypothetical protein
MSTRTPCTNGTQILLMRLKASLIAEDKLVIIPHGKTVTIIAKCKDFSVPDAPAQRISLSSNVPPLAMSASHEVRKSASRKSIVGCGEYSKTIPKQYECACSADSRHQMMDEL